MNSDLYKVGFFLSLCFQKPLQSMIWQLVVFLFGMYVPLENVTKAIFAGQELSCQRSWQVLLSQHPARESPEAAQEMGRSESWEGRTVAKGLASATQPGARQAAG